MVKLFIFRFTYKSNTDKSVNEYYVEAPNLETARQALAAKLNANPELLRNNGKNIPMDKRTLIYNNTKAGLPGGLFLSIQEELVPSTPANSINLNHNILKTIRTRVKLIVSQQEPLLSYYTETYLLATNNDCLTSAYDESNPDVSIEDVLLWDTYSKTMKQDIKL